MLLPSARMATTDIIRMRARLTGTTGLAGSTAESLSGLVRGSAAASDSGRDSDADADLIADSVGVLDSVDGPDSAAGRDLVVGRESAYVDRRAVDSTGMFHVEVISTAADRMAAVVSTAVAVRTVVVVRTVEDTGADTGKNRQ